MNFSSINIQGNIISSEILDKIRTLDNFPHQKPEAFGLARGAAIRDEIGMAWAILRTHWQSYKKRLEMLPADDTGTSLTREKWIIPFLTELGYEVSKQSKLEINGKSYAISHSASNLGQFPIHIMGYNDNLDKRREIGGPRLSSHALVQEYLNNTEHLYALVTNGKHLRLLRDATRLVRMSYLEFDLERMMEEELYADFAILFRVLHASRMPKDMETGSGSVIEFYHLESLASGSRIREKLSEAVEDSIKLLANGFLSHPKNKLLIAILEDEKLKPETYYMFQLRLIYRLLFLIVLEERKLIYPEKRDEATERLRKIYFKYYSIEHLRKLAENYVFVDGDKYDLWQNLKSTFLLFENEHYGEKLGIGPLGSGLFDADALGILSHLEISNKDLVSVLRKLTTFLNEQGQLVRVNYSDLDVEEFGSVYEGLLDYDPSIEKIGSRWEFSFIPGAKRADSGAHYTPEELVKPLIKHSLDYIIQDRLKEPQKFLGVNLPPFGGNEGGTSEKEAALLSIRVCDVACGSGHILLSAARRIATELASIREIAEQPSPTYYRAALRDVIKNCIYGVDYNPLAVELCKVALWLEAHNPGEPLNFLDHHIKCGNSIVGLAHIDELKKGIADEAFKTLPGDEKDTAKYFRDKNKREREQFKGHFKIDFEVEIANKVEEMAVSYGDVNRMPEQTPMEVEAKARAYGNLMTGSGWMRLKQLADMQVAQFFIPKSPENENYILTDETYRDWLNTKTLILGQAPAFASRVSAEKKFFHWFLEFPTIIQQGGFDCIIGNPPFKGGQKLTGAYGNSFAEYIKFQYAPIGSVDLVTYFFRRVYTIIKRKGFLSLISTSTIAQGDARIGGLAEIYKQGGTINHGLRSIKWPGAAAVDVVLVTIHKGEWKGKFLLDNKEVNQITSYLDDSIPLGDPYPLKSNENKSFQGSILLGQGFVLTHKDAKLLIEKDPRNVDVLFPYLIGDDLNNQIDQSPTRWVINFHNWPLRRYSSQEWNEIPKELQNEIQDKIDNGRTIEFAPPKYVDKVAYDYPDCLSIIEFHVKPERLKQNRDIRKIYWWLHAERAKKLYKTASKTEYIIGRSLTSKYHYSCLIEGNIVIDQTIIVWCFLLNNISNCIQSTIHFEWSKKESADMMGTGSRYNISKGFETFPFPESFDHSSENIGKNYHFHRKQLMKNIKLGITKTYNAFHAKGILNGINNDELKGYTSKAIEKQYGKEVWNLWSHLQKTPNTCTIEEAIAGIIELRRLHVEMDNAVLEAYGWNVDSEKWGKAIKLAHDFYGVDYLPENDRVRFTISPAARKEILKRLLLLNHERYEEEIQQGLHKKQDVEEFYKQKGEPIPPGIPYSDKKPVTYKKGKAKNQVNEPKADYEQRKLF